MSRHTKELVKAEILEVQRLRRGNQYTLSKSIPFEVCDPARASNKQLLRLVNERLNLDLEDEEPEEVEEEPSEDENHVAEMQHEEAEAPEVMLQERSGHVAKMQHENGSHVASVQHPNVAKMQHVDDEVHQREVHQEKRSTSTEDGEPLETARVSEKVESSGDPSARFARDEGSQDRKKETYVTSEPETPDPSELMDEESFQAEAPRKRRKKRAASSALVQGSQGKALSNAGKPSEGTKVDEASEPPIDSVSAVQALFRSEVEAKYGSDALRQLPARVGGKLKTQITKVVLDQYEPEVVRSMVRLLVWDWEIARMKCFPFRPEVPVPRLEALVQWTSDLAGTINTGFKYDANLRGRRKTYANRYLKEAVKEKHRDFFA